jgi:hypothetical protein
MITAHHCTALAVRRRSGVPGKQERSPRLCNTLSCLGADTLFVSPHQSRKPLGDFRFELTVGGR